MKVTSLITLNIIGFLFNGFGQNTKPDSSNYSFTIQTPGNKDGEKQGFENVDEMLKALQEQMDNNGFSLNEDSEVSYPHPKYRFSKMMELVNRAYPSAHFVLSKFEQNDIEFWIPTSEEYWVEEVPTAVHEQLHHWDFHLSSYNEKCYFMNKTKVAKVPLTKVYPSNEMTNLVPDSLKAISIRYETYVGNASNHLLTSIQHGIYGLLEEFNAYYHGNKTHFNLLKNGDLVYAPNTNTDLFNAYYEFNIFMACYLMHAQANHPEIYRDIIANKELKFTYTAINNLFAQLIDEVNANPKYRRNYSMDVKRFFTAEHKKALQEITHFN